MPKNSRLGGGLFVPFLLALAFSINALDIEFIPGVRLLFGSIFVCILAAIRGPVWATVGGFLAGLVPFALWQSPADLLIFTLEGLSVALVYPRLRSLTLAALAYWALLGLPVFILTHMDSMHSAFGWVLPLKLGTNGAFNALVADMILLLLAQRFGVVSRALGGLSLNQVLAGVFLLATLLPATLLTFVYTRTTLKGIEKGIASRLISEASEGALAIENIIKRQTEALWSLAHRADERPPKDQFVGYAALVQSVFPEFHTLLMIGGDGMVEACLSDRFDCPKLTRSFLGNEFLTLIQGTKSPLVLDGLPIGLPGLEGKPAIVVPRTPGQGVVVGSLDWALLGSVLFRAIDPGVSVRLVDEKGNPRLTSHPFLEGGKESVQYELRRLNEGILLAIRQKEGLKKGSFVKRWMGSFYLYRLPIQRTPWVLETKAAFSTMMDRLAMTLFLGLMAFWGLALILIFISWAISRMVSRPLGQLQTLALKLKDKQFDPTPVESWPSTPIVELASLSSTLKAMWEALRDSLIALKASNESLEAEVAKRTEAIQCTIDRLKAQIERSKELEGLIERTQTIARIGSWERDLRTNEMVYSKETYRIFGLKEDEEPSYERFMAAVHPKDRDTVQRAIEDAIQNRLCLDFDYRIVRGDGQVRYIREKAETVCDEKGVPIKLLGTNQDITEEKLTDLALEESEATLRTLLTALPLAVGLKDGQGRWLLANPLTLELFRLQGKDYVGKTDAELAQIVPELAETLAYCQVTDERTWKAGTLCRFEEKVGAKDAQGILLELTKVPLFEADGSRKGLIFVGRDITEERAALKRIEQLTYYDELTGLPNRLLLTERLRQILSHHGSAAVVLIDLDRFKVLNESLGFEASNRILEEAALRLQALVRHQDTLSRPWGDEFYIVMPEIGSAEDLGDAAVRILSIFKKPFQVYGSDVFVTASLGLAMAPKDGSDADTLLKNAEMAMYRSKEKGGDAYSFYSSDLDSKVSEYLLLEASLRKALNDGAFSLHYQPQVALSTGSIIGCEALLRLNSRELGMVSPAKFIPVAERSGLILPIGEWVLKEAVNQLKAWHKMGFYHLYVSVNLSAKQFQDPNLLSMVRDCLTGTGLSPEHLELEVTESTAMLDVQQAIEILTEIKSMGIRIAMDDFGVEYSSLNYIKRLPIDTIKIDQSFIREGLQDPFNHSIVKAIIEIARSLGLKVIAEGVESKEQLIFLHALECYGIQGYIFSRPLPPDSFFLMLNEDKKLEIT